MRALPIPTDVWAGDAFSTVSAPVAELTAEEMERGTRVTCLGQVHGTVPALKRMRTRNRGTIVNVGSEPSPTVRCRSNRSAAAPGAATWADRIAPAFADRGLARYGYASQITDRMLPETYKGNLWEPVPGDYGAHGRFDKA